MSRLSLKESERFANSVLNRIYDDKYDTRLSSSRDPVQDLERLADCVFFLIRQVRKYQKKVPQIVSRK